MYLLTPPIITNSLYLHINKPSHENSTLLNYHTEYPQKYKIVIIKKLIHRAFYISSFKTIFYKKLINIKLTQVNNNFPNKQVDQQIKYIFKTFTKIIAQPTITTLTINLYYRNQMHNDNK